MDKERFEKLQGAIDEMRAHWRGEETGVRVSFVGEPDPRKIRERLGLTQEDFAHVLGISTRTLQNWEQGRREPTGPAMKLLQIAARHPEILLEMA